MASQLAVVKKSHRLRGGHLGRQYQAASDPRPVVVAGHLSSHARWQEHPWQCK